MQVSDDWCAYIIRIIVGNIIKISISFQTLISIFVTIEYESFVAFDINLSYISDQHWPYILSLHKWDLNCMKTFFTKMLDANELISSFNKPVNHHKQENVCEVNEANGWLKWQMSNFSVYYWKTERQTLLATRIFLLFGGIFCHCLILGCERRNSNYFLIWFLYK